MRVYGYLSDCEIIHHNKRYDYLGDPLPDDAEPQTNEYFRWSYIHNKWIPKTHWYEQQEQAAGKKQGFDFEENVIPVDRYRVALAYQRKW